MNIKTSIFIPFFFLISPTQQGIFVLAETKKAKLKKDKIFGYLQTFTEFSVHFPFCTSKAPAEVTGTHRGGI